VYQKMQIPNAPEMVTIRMCGCEPQPTTEIQGEPS
jgi:hypothetical protein